MKDSWLKPNGKLIEVGTFQHSDYAWELLTNEMGKETLFDILQEQGFSSPSEILHQRGWVRIKFNTFYLPVVEILGNSIDLTKPMRNTIDPPMNSKQLKVAKDLCLKHNTSFHNAINDKRFW